MAEEEKRIGQVMADAIACLPEEKKQYFLGFAEGVSAMASLTRENDSE